MFEELREKYRRFREWQQEPYRVKPMSKEAHDCPTCGTHFEGNYCPRCGQSATIGRYSFKKAFLLFLDVWGLGNRGMFRTIRDLILRPGYMIRDYLQGMQMAYFPPFKMYFLLLALNLVIDTGFNLKMENRLEKGKIEYNEGLRKSLNLDEPATDATNPLDNPVDSSNKAYEWTINHLSIVTMVFLLLFSFPLYMFFRKSPAYPGLKYSEFFVTMVYTTNMMTVYSIIVSFLGLSMVVDLAIYVLTIIPMKQLSGYSYWRVILNSVVAFILFFIVAVLLLFAGSSVYTIINYH
jgi:hypothetical protein